MVETCEIHDADGNVIGSYDRHSHLRRSYASTGQFVLADGRRFNLKWIPKYSRNIQFWA